MTTRCMFSEGRVNFDLKAATKKEVINELIEMLYKDGKLNDREAFTKVVLEREADFSTGIGFGIAIPHGKSDAVKEPCIAFGRSNTGIEYEAFDEKTAHLFFLLAVPSNASDVHLKAISEISRNLMHEDIREKLINAKSFSEFIEVWE